MKIILFILCLLITSTHAKEAKIASLFCNKVGVLVNLVNNNGSYFEGFMAASEALQRDECVYAEIVLELKDMELIQNFKDITYIVKIIGTGVDTKVELNNIYALLNPAQYKELTNIITKK